LQPTSKDLLTAVSQGDTIAFQQLHERFSAKMYSTALSYAQQEQEAEEIVQDVFVKVVRKAHQFKGNSTVSTWIYRITVNTALSRIQFSKKRFLGQPLEQIPNAENFYHLGILLENKENAQQLYAAIQHLPDRQKTAFILSFIEELPQQEVADIMQTSHKVNTDGLLYHHHRTTKNRSNLSTFILKKKEEITVKHTLITHIAFIDCRHAPSKFHH
jgi:RNA polymerase sigma-70 factor (ECF subfamily)